MKKYFSYLNISLLLIVMMSHAAYAQQKLIYYWHFNNLVNFTTVAVNPSTFPVIRPNYTTLDSTKSFIKFAPLSGTAGNVLTYYDNVSPGDTLNARLGQPAGLGLRPRNPTDSMQLMFYIPTNYYKNITVKYEAQKSSASNGAANDSLDYSIDSGATWRNSGITPLIASNGTGAWSTSVISAVISDTLAFNNNKLVFRIRFIGPGNTGTSGNVRLDNVTVEGDSIQAPKLVHYWHFNNLGNFTTVAVSPSTFPIVKANYSTLDTNRAFLKFAPLAGTSGNMLTYFDNVSPGDTVNARMGQPAGLGFRPRNPSDSMQLMVFIPSTGYKNIVIKFEVQKSSASNGGATDSLDYSLDSGITWKNSGITPLIASNGAGAWSSPNSPITASISDYLSWNTSKLVFRIRFNGPGNTGTSGNVRIDNLTIEGDTFIGTYPLPVQLTEFHAELLNRETVHLAWRTASEKNNDHFEIQRSVSSNSEGVWEDRFQMKGSNYDGMNLYAFDDHVSDLMNQVNAVFYRLKQVDVNGTFIYSDIVSVKLNVSPSDVTIENPVTGICHIHFASTPGSMITYCVRDFTGALLVTNEMNVVQYQSSIDLSNLKIGIYFLELNLSSGDRIVKKIIRY